MFLEIAPLYKKQKRLISKTGFLISELLNVFVISFFTIYISQSHFKILFPIPTFTHPSPKKANPNFPVTKKANPSSHFTPSLPSVNVKMLQKQGSLTT